jgi:hypothetical protein
MLRIHLRNLLMKTWSLCRRPLVVFQVSAPYKRMVFTLELNNQTLVFNEIFLAFQIDPIILNAVLAFPILILTSLSDPPRLSTSLSKGVYFFQILAIYCQICSCFCV